MQHDLAPHYPALCRFRSTREPLGSAIYRRLEPEIERILNSLVEANHAEGAAPAARRAIRVTAWNIERGKELAGVLRVLETHPVGEPRQGQRCGVRRRGREPRSLVCGTTRWPRGARP